MAGGRKHISAKDVTQNTKGIEKSSVGNFISNDDPRRIGYSGDSPMPLAAIPVELINDSGFTAIVNLTQDVNPTMIDYIATTLRKTFGRQGMNVLIGHKRSQEQFKVKLNILSPKEITEEYLINSRNIQEVSKKISAFIMTVQQKFGSKFVVLPKNNGAEIIVAHYGYKTGDGKKNSNKERDSIDEIPVPTEGAQPSHEISPGSVPYRLSEFESLKIRLREFSLELFGRKALQSVKLRTVHDNLLLEEENPLCWLLDDLDELARPFLLEGEYRVDSFNDYVETDPDWYLRRANRCLGKLEQLNSDYKFKIGSFFIPVVNNFTSYIRLVFDQFIDADLDIKEVLEGKEYKQQRSGQERSLLQNRQLIKKIKSYSSHESNYYELEWIRSKVREEHHREFHEGKEALEPTHPRSNFGFEIAAALKGRDLHEIVTLFEEQPELESLFKDAWILRYNKREFPTVDPVLQEPSKYRPLNWSDVFDRIKEPIAEDLTDEEKLVLIAALQDAYAQSKSGDIDTDQFKLNLAQIFGEEEITPDLDKLLIQSTSLATGQGASFDPNSVPPLPTRPIIRWKVRHSKWTDRPDDINPEDPVAFIHYHYEQWINPLLPEEKQLTTTKLRTLDRGLREAYDKWIKVHDVPQEKLLPSLKDLIHTRLVEIDEKGLPTDRKEYSRVMSAKQRAKSNSDQTER